MARAATSRNEAPQHRTGPRRVGGGFQPAQRSMTPPPHEEFPDTEGEDEIEGVTMRERENQPTTKSGFPDRRFKGQRDLPPPIQENVQRARTGGVIDDVHITIDGRPDRRFKENRSLSDDEVQRQWLDHMNKRYGGNGGRGGAQRR